MRILQVNKFFYLRGGSERYFFDLCSLLQERGHEVLHFSMSHPRNRPSDQARHFVSEIDLNACTSPAEKIRAAARILYSREAKVRIGRLMDELRPDIVHFHNITRQISPSVIDAAAERKIPAVMTMHDLALVCPAHAFFVGGRACEDCAGGKYWHALTRRCIDGSISSTMLGTLEGYLHAGLGLYRKVEVLIAPSRFLAGKVATLGWARDRIVHLPYFIPLGPDYSEEGPDHVLFAGRISYEKGVGTLLEAAAKLRSVRFVVAGEGPPLENFKRFARDGNLSNVEFVGYVKGDELEKLIKTCALVVVPSNSYENLPLSILEAFARGKPAVGSDCGGIPELVIDGQTGYGFAAGDADSLAHAVERALEDEPGRIAMGKNARALVAGDYSADYHYGRIMDIYRGLMG